MSIFDKFKGNPYVSTYAGAPVDAFNQVASNLQAKYDKNIADMDAIEMQFDALQTLDIDQQQKDLIRQNYQESIEQLSQAPESATRGVRKLAAKFATDPKLALLKSNRAKVLELEKKIEEEGYSNYQTRKFREALDEYNKLGGAAAGIQFTGFTRDEKNKGFYEEQNIGNLVDERVEGIKAVKLGNARINEATGQIETVGGEEISMERVTQSALGVLADETVRRQVYDEYVYNTRPEDIPTDAAELEGALRTYFFNKYIGGDLGGAIAKYAKKDQVSKLKGIDKDLETSGGDTQGVVMAAPTALLDPFVAEVTRRKYEKTPQQVYDRIKDLDKIMSTGDWGQSDPQEIYNEYTFLQNSLKDALTTDEQGLSVIDDPNLRDILKGFSTDELWEVAKIQGVLPELLAGFEELATSSEPIDVLKFNTYIRKFEYRYGKYSGMPIRETHSKARNRAVETREIARSRGVTMGLDEFTQLVGQYHKEELANLMQDPTFTNISRERVDREMLAQMFMDKNNLTEEQAQEYAFEVSKAMDDTWWRQTYQDSMKKGLESVYLEREAIAPNKILPDKTIANINAGLQNIFRDMTDEASINLEAIRVLDEGKLRAADMDDFEGFNPQEMEITGLEIGAGIGAIQVKMPAIDGKQSKTLDIQLDPNTSYSSIHATILDGARTRAKVSGNEGLRKQAEQVALSYSGTEYLKQGAFAFAQNEGRTGDARQTIADPTISNIFGPLIPVQNADGEFYFEQVNGQILHNRKFPNMNMALLYLSNKAQE